MSPSSVAQLFLMNCKHPYIAIIFQTMKILMLETKISINNLGQKFLP